MVTTPTRSLAHVREIPRLDQVSQTHEIGVDPTPPEELQAAMQDVQWPTVEAV